MPNCKECNKPFEKKRKWQLFCSVHCRITNWDKKHPRVSIEKLDKLLK